MSKTEPDPTAFSASDVRRRFGLWNSLKFWRQWGIGASLAVVALVAVVIFDPASNARYIAVLQAEDGRTGWVVNLDLAEARILTHPIAPNVSKDFRIELWLLDDAAKPRLLDTISDDGPTTVLLDVEAARAVGPHSELAIVSGGDGSFKFRGKLLPGAP